MALCRSGAKADGAGREEAGETTSWDACPEVERTPGKVSGMGFRRHAGSAVRPAREPR